jgi:hypothetical protein
MNLDFDFGSVKATEFGIGRDVGDGQSFCCITVDNGVQAALREMAEDTWQQMRTLNASPEKYDPSEKHGGVEHLYLPLKDDLTANLRALHEANNLPMDGHALEDPGSVFSYFSRFTDGSKRRLTALHRAGQFKGVLKSRLIRMATDALKLVEDKVFKLDNDFDVLIDSARLHMLRPSAFEFAGQLESAILAAVPENVQAIQQELSFVRFDEIATYASKHPRAARYLASIRSQEETANIDKGLLKKLCKTTRVEVAEHAGKLIVADGHIMGFLEVLDRRRYELELVQGSPERFKAGSRSRIPE